MDFSFRNKVVGIDMGSYSLKTVQLLKREQDYQLVSCSYYQLANNGDKEEELVAGLQKIVSQQKLRRAKIVLGINQPAVVIRQLTFPIMTDEELSEAIPWEIKRVVPYDLDETELDFQIMNKNTASARMEVLVVLIPKTLLEEYNTIIEKVALRTQINDVNPLALMNAFFLNYQLKPKEVVILLDIGASFTILNIYQEEGMYLVRNIPIAGNSFTHLLQRELKLSYEDAERIKRVSEKITIIQPALEKLIFEIRKTVTFYKNQTVVNGINYIILTGGSAALPGLREHLANELTTPVTLFDPFEHIKKSKKEKTLGIAQATQWATAVGLASR